VPDEGHPGLLLVANHVSWLDILAIDATLPSRFVSKAEVRRWPVIGWLAAMAGTLFLERGKRRDAARMGELMAGALSAGSVVAVFPEGTVGDGRRLLPFHANLLQPAVAASAQVLPVAIKYVDEWPARDGSRPDAMGEAVAAALWRGPSSAAVAYDGDVTIGHSILRVLKARGLAVHLALCPLMDPGDDRKRLAKHARQAIAHVLTVDP
jgi:1-acyl-sn-glycerol-3-phosphate acyltransferase